MRKLFLILLTIMVLLIPITAFAIGVGPSDYTGSRTVPAANGIKAYEEWAADFDVSWSIVVNPTYVSYSYTFAVPQKDFSHIILEVSTDATSADFSDFNWTNREGPITFDPGPGNPGMPVNVFGIKFDELTSTTHTLTFKSTRLPMWGDFYAKSGGGNEFPGAVIAYNTGFGTDPTIATLDFTPWIPVPNSAVPLPGAVLLLGAGMARLVAYARRRKE